MKSARPISDKTSYNFIKKNMKVPNLYDDTMLETYTQNYSKWIQSSKLNNLKNLNKFKSIQYTHGTAQSFDFFYLKHHKKRFRIFRGDFMYHQIMFRFSMDWDYIFDDELREGDAVILSLPFSDYGDIHPFTDMILSECDKLNIPVMIDCAYMVMARNINFDFNKKCIEAVCFSLSKGFYGAEKLRIGLRFTKEYVDDGVEVFNSFKFVNHAGLYVGIKLFEKFETDYIQNKYYKKQLKICKELDIQPSKCVIFGIADKRDKRFDEYNRGTDWRRICISEKLGENNV